MVLIVFAFSSLGIKANAVYYTPIIQPICSGDILGRILIGVLTSGYSNCNYSNNYNSYCNTNTNLGKINNVYTDQNTTSSNMITVTAMGTVFTNCVSSPLYAYMNITDQFGNFLVYNDYQSINFNSNCTFNNSYNNCTNFISQVQIPKSNFINKTLRVEMSFNPKNTYAYYTPFENSNAFPLDYYISNNYDCNLYNTCFINSPIIDTIPFGGIKGYEEVLTTNTPIGCQLNPIDYYYDNCYFI
jgi:hypothetical protein